MVNVNQLSNISSVPALVKLLTIGNIDNLFKKTTVACFSLVKVLNNKNDSKFMALSLASKCSYFDIFVVPDHQ